MTHGKLTSCTKLFMEIQFQALGRCDVRLYCTLVIYFQNKSRVRKSCLQSFYCEESPVDVPGGLTQPSTAVHENLMYLLFSCFGFDCIRNTGCGVCACEKGQMHVCHAQCVKVGTSAVCPCNLEAKEAYASICHSNSPCYIPLLSGSFKFLPKFYAAGLSR